MLKDINTQSDCDAVVGDIFITDVTCNGNVGDKVYAATIPANVDLLSCTTDSREVTIHFLAEGGGDNYNPSVGIGTTSCTNLSQYGDDRRVFSGSVSINVTDPSPATIVINSSTGASDSVIITFAEGGPEILSAILGPYPGSQTALKLGDTLNVSGTVEIDATHIRLLDYGVFNATGWIPVSGPGTFSINGVVSNRAGTLTARLQAKNSLGTGGPEYTTVDTRDLDQIIPSLTLQSVVYPTNQEALKDNETADVIVTATDFDVIQYSSPNGELSVPDDTVYTETKTVTRIAGGYNIFNYNYQVTVGRSSNGATNSIVCVVYIAHTAAVLNFSITGSPTRLQSSPSPGADYQIILSSNQNLIENPTFTASHPLSAIWKMNSTTYAATLTVIDGAPTGSFSFNNVSAFNLARRETVVAGNDSYNVGGFLMRILTVAPWPNREADIGVPVTNPAKLLCTNLSKGTSGSYNCIYKASTDSELDKFTVTSPSGVHNANGNLWYNCDTPNASSNTTGLMQIEIEEEA